MGHRGHPGLPGTPGTPGPRQDASDRSGEDQCVSAQWQEMAASVGRPLVISRQLPSASVMGFEIWYFRVMSWSDSESERVVCPWSIVISKRKRVPG